MDKARIVDASGKVRQAGYPAYLGRLTLAKAEAGWSGPASYWGHK